jgi:citrate lyase subunit beta / citryl-CoA lyase
VNDFPRSFLFVPGNRPSFIDSALRSPAEAIVFDLEDSVAADQKAAARVSVRSILEASPRHRAALYVRINSDPHGKDDLQALAGVPVAGLIVPKAESAAAVRRIVSESGGAAVVLLVETPRGVLAALDLGEAAGSSLAALAFGAEDFRAAMGVDSVDADPLLSFALPMVAVAAAALGVPAIDAPEMNFADLERLRARAASARALGFRAKFAIHPSQLPIIHEAFGPSSLERLWAERVTRAYEQGRAEGHGSVRVDDRVVDAATVKRARRILERSQA